MLEQLLTQFLDHLRYERNVSAHTLRNYESDLRQFIDYLAPSKDGTAGKPASKRASSSHEKRVLPDIRHLDHITIDRKSTRLNSSHSQISYAVFCLKKKKK